MENKEFSSINVVPFVDIMLVLLTIVLTTATFIVHRAIPVNLPTAESGKDLSAEKTLSITLRKDGRLFLEKREITRSKLREALSRISGSTTINVRVDREAKVEHLVGVMDILSQFDLRKVNLVVKKR